MTKIFITGGTGRLGKYVVPLFLENGYEVCVLTRSKSIDGCKLVHGNLHDFDYAEIKGCDWVVHLAASTDMSAGYSTLHNINVEGTKSVLERCEQAGVENLLYISSISVYGKSDNSSITESTHLNPDTPYARTKFEAEMVCKNFIGNVCIFRPSMIYGEGFDKGFATAYKMIRKGSMPIFGDGNNHIPLVYARDVANAILLAVRKGQTGIYNINNDVEMTQSELLDYVAELINAPRKHFHINRAFARPFLALYNAYNLLRGSKRLPYEFVQMLMHDRVVISEKARKDFGFANYTSLKDGLRDFVSYLHEKYGPAPD